MAKSPRKTRRPPPPAALPKCPTGIPGLDQITCGGLPRGRPTLICGGSGSGKTLLGMEFIVKGAMEYDEPGVFMAFEEGAADLAKNVASIGFDVAGLTAAKKLVIDHVHVERAEIEATGEYNLDGLFIRLGFAIDAIGAKRVVLDTVDTLFAALPNPAILRMELRRLFDWLKDKGVTAIVTGERGEGSFTRTGLEEYVSDCVILLDNRVIDQISTRRLRIVKYRGSAHGADEYPFLLDELGFTVVPVTAIGLQYTVSTEFISTGIPKLDAMLGGEGYYRGGTLLVSGTAGTGKTSVAAHYVDAACRRGERCLYVAFEESPHQLMRNMRSIGIDLKQWVDKGLLRFEAARPNSFGLEMHLALIQRATEQFQARVAVLDPISSLESAGGELEARCVLMRLIDFFKSRQISVLLTTLTSGGGPMEQTEVGISSLIDTWLLLRNLEQGGERIRALYVLKSRGMAHSSRVREFLLTDRGVDLIDVYVGPSGILTGSARAVQEMEDQATQLRQHQDAERRRLLIERKRRALESRIAELQAEFEAERSEAEAIIADAEATAQGLLARRGEIAVAAVRLATPAGARPATRKGARK